MFRFINSTCSPIHFSFSLSLSLCLYALLSSATFVTTMPYTWHNYQWILSLVIFFSLFISYFVARLSLSRLFFLRFFPLSVSHSRNRAQFLQMITWISTWMSEWILSKLQTVNDKESGNLKMWRKNETNFFFYIGYKEWAIWRASTLNSNSHIDFNDISFFSYKKNRFKKIKTNVH